MNRPIALQGSLIAALAIATLGCGAGQEAANRQAASDQSARADVDPAHQQRAIQAKDALLAELSGRLMEVMGSQGPAAAIDVCSREAGQIAKEVAARHSVAMGRTSVKLRNPRNVPPPWATPMIKTMPTEPKFVTLPDGHTGALLPIKLKAVCTVCHGDPDLISDDVKAELARRYPNDRATGFKEGDLRGWFWVDVPNSRPVPTDPS